MPGVFNFNNEGRKKVEELHSVIQLDRYQIEDLNYINKKDEFVKRKLINGIAEVLFNELDKLPIEVTMKAGQSGKEEFKLDMILISEDEYRRLHWKDRMFKTPEEVYSDDRFSAVLIEDGEGITCDEFADKFAEIHFKGKGDE